MLFIYTLQYDQSGYYCIYSSKHLGTTVRDDSDEYLRLSDTVNWIII